MTKKSSTGVANRLSKLKLKPIKNIGSSKLSGSGFWLGRFPPACERIIKGVKKSNKSKPKSKRANPFAIAQSNPKCRKALKLWLGKMTNI